MDEPKAKLGGFVTSYIALIIGVLCTFIWIFIRVPDVSTLLHMIGLVFIQIFGLLNLPVGIISIVRSRTHRRPWWETMFAGIGIFLGLVPIIVFRIYALLAYLNQ